MARTATAAGGGSSRGGGALSNSRGPNGRCEKCDGLHDTAACTFYRKERENHPDARRTRALGSSEERVLEVLPMARVVRQPPDGSCLFHSLSHGLRDGSTAMSLRRQIGSFMQAHPELLISDSPLREWVRWDSGTSMQAYVRKIMHGNAWGGGIEMAVFAIMKRVSVHVYQTTWDGAFLRISRFPAPGGGDNNRVVRVLYRGGVHFDAIETPRTNVVTPAASAARPSLATAGTSRDAVSAAASRSPRHSFDGKAGVQRPHATQRPLHQLHYNRHAIAATPTPTHSYAAARRKQQLGRL